MEEDFQGKKLKWFADENGQLIPISAVNTFSDSKIYYRGSSWKPMENNGQRYSATAENYRQAQRTAVVGPTRDFVFEDIYSHPHEINETEGVRSTCIRVTTEPWICKTLV